ncbi:uncharacterized protein LOC132893026 [Neoarius graeffei]|uniref:uncharacterized protein LOC132893026 n=1 Tax=Neoarius graeffei TaxID=443677 RepID=UPI00298CF0AB|nr:uncharacterized protein LOC132893026 [Neoarius graeffei]
MTYCWHLIRAMSPCLYCLTLVQPLTLDHSILLDTLENIVGLKGTALSWLRSYLTDCYKFVDVNGDFSRHTEVKFGVPQGSLGNICNICISFHCYTVETQLNVSAKPDERLQRNKIEECVKDVRYWMLINFLILSYDKTEVLVLGPHVARSRFSDYIVTLDGLSVSSRAAVKDLAVILDSSFLFETHIDNITQTTFFHLRNIVQIRNIMSLHDAEILVHAFVTSRLYYCNALLSGCSSKCINKIQLVQNAAARALTRTRRYDHITPMLSTLHWLPIKFCTDYKILLLTFFFSSPHWIATLSWSRNLCVSVTPRTMPAGDLSPGRAHHAGQAEG